MPIPEAIQSFLAGNDPQVRAVALRLRALVLEVMPQAIEEVDTPGRLLGYSLDRTYKGTICVIMPLNQGVNLAWHSGAELPDPGGL